MGYITSKSSFRTYIRQMLGEPVITVELTDEQLDNNINLAVEHYIEFIEGGVQLRFMNLTTEAGKDEYTLPIETYAIYKTYDTSNIKVDTVFPDRLASEAYATYMQQADLLSLHITRTYLENLDYLWRVIPIIEYNSLTRKLFFLEPHDEVKSIGIVYYHRTDTSDNSPIYDHLWIKKYATALCKKQWGVNLTKYTGSILPQGLTMNGMEYYNQAITELDQLKDELYSTWRLPVDFFVG